MKCQKCDAKVRDNDKYCGNCGTKVRKENKCVKFLVKNKVKLIILAVLLVLLITVYNVTSYITSPIYVANKYFKAVMSNDIETIYNMINLSDNDFMNIKVLSEKVDTYNASDIYIIDKIVTNNEALITYAYRENGQIYRAMVSVTKSGNKWLLFDNWKINSGKVASNITIKMPTGSIVTVDGIELTNYLDRQENGFDIYIIDYMVNGEYTLGVTLQDQQTMYEEFETVSNTEYKIDSIDASEEIKEEVTQITKDLITDMYKNIIAATSYDDVDYNDNIKNMYKNLSYKFKKSKYNLTNIEFNDFSIVKSTFVDGKLYVIYQVEYDYSIKYNLNDEEKTYSGVNRGVVSATYNYENGYNIDTIEKLNLSF